MAIVALLAGLVFPRYVQTLDRSREVVLKENLRITRSALEKFYGDTGRYPDSLEEMVDRHYLRSLPVDPITESAGTWILVTPKSGIKGNVYDIRSGALGETVDGKAYGEL